MRLSVSNNSNSPFVNGVNGTDVGVDIDVDGIEGGDGKVVDAADGGDVIGGGIWAVFVGVAFNGSIIWDF